LENLILNRTKTVSREQSFYGRYLNYYSSFITGFAEISSLLAEKGLELPSPELIFGFAKWFYDSSCLAIGAIHVPT
jgi:hypothetical protein